MKTIFKRLFYLFFGLLLYALGIVLTMQANIGYSPWEVFHAGLAKILNTQIGTMTTFVGLIIGIITLIFGEKIGFGSIVNMICIGLFMNLLLASQIFVELSNPFYGILQLVVGLFVISFASYFYISSGYGAGPRDSLMVLLARKSRFSVGSIRAAMEITVTVIGALLGGFLGWGTLLSAILIGFCVQITFKLLRFDPRLVEHEDLFTTLKLLKAKVQKREV